MAWSSTFIAWLSADVIAPAARLVFVDMPDAIAATPAGRIFTSHTASAVGGREIAAIAGWTHSEQRYEPSQGRATSSEWTVTLTGDLRGVLDGLPPGCWAELHVGDRSWDKDSYEVAEVGRLVALRRDGLVDAVELVFEPLVVALQCRLTVDAGAIADPEDSEAQLFYQLRDENRLTVDTAYSAGASKLVYQSGEDASAFERELGEVGMLRVEPTGGEPFYLEWSSLDTTAREFTLPVTGGQRGTTDASAATGSVIVPVALMRGHPVDILRRILASSGTRNPTLGNPGDGGVYDVYPESWGIDPNAVVPGWVSQIDLPRFARKVLVDSDGSRSDYQWELIVEEAVESGLAWFTNIAAQAGIFLCVRQGELTIRAVQDMDPGGSQPVELHEAGFHITDDDIISFGPWEGSDPGMEAAARLCRVSTGDSSYGRAVRASQVMRFSPVIDSVERDMSAVYWSGTGEPQKAAQNDADRWLSWVGQAREIWTLTVSLRFAQYTIGDVGRLTSARIYGCQAQTAQGYDDQLCMILGHRPTFLPGDDGPAVTLVLAVVDLPTTDGT